MTNHSDIQVSPKGYIAPTGVHHNEEDMREGLRNLPKCFSVTQDEWGDITVTDENGQSWVYVQVID